MPQTSLNPQSGLFGGQRINNNNSDNNNTGGSSGSSCDSNDLSSSPRDRDDNGRLVGKRRDEQQSERPASCIISGNNLVNQQCLPSKYAMGGLDRKDLDSVLSLTAGFQKCREHKMSLHALLQADPYNNFLVNGLDALRQEARWPIECQVLPERVRHIDYSPAEPEPFNVPTGKEPRPKPVGEDMGTVIFRYCPATSTNYFSRSCIGGSAALERTVGEPPSIINTTTNVNNQTADDPTTTTTTISSPPTPQQSNDLCFESRFESGNLGKVIKITDTFYQLHLRKDLYTQRHMQWYYFRISNTRSGVLYRLSIVNLCKEDSLYNEGLRPLCYSTKEAKLNSIGWRRCGENICYYKNDCCSDEEKERHTLSFNIRFEHDQDTVYIAHSYPYTYSDLQDYLVGIAGDPLKTRFTKLRLLCRTLAGNGVYYLTITAPPVIDSSNEAGPTPPPRRKKGIVITARVHPGETPSSWIMKGICDFLTGESNQARELRERFIFKLVPMLNPDGVIVGNNRCSLSGKDLNRQYRTVLRESYPSVWHTKLMIRRLMEDCGIAMYCDLHAHSRKHNVFIYGCESKRPGCGPREGRLAEQVFPLMLHKNAADKFSFENCKFHIEKGKEGTGRVVVWLMGIQNSYTMEASLGGSVLGSRNGTHFSCQDYEQIGKAFCETLLDFSDSDPLKERLRSKIIARLIKEGSSADEPTNIELTDYSSDEGDTSDSSSEEDRYTTSEMLRRRLNSCEEYLAAPPPSPLLLKPATAESYKKTSKTKNKLPKIVLMRRKAMRNRKTLDLPTTDPGSDLYELSDSADETVSRLKVKSSDEEERLIELIEKENRRRKEAEELELPQIPRPRSVSLGEDIMSADLDKKTRRLRHRRIPMPLRNLSPTNAQDNNGQVMKVKLMPLRQNYWTGVTNNCDWENEENLNYLQRNDCPLSWGVSKMAFEYQSDSEALLLSCSRKLEELSYMQSDYKKTKKKTRRKPSKLIDASTVINPLDEKNQSNNKKKKPKVKKPKTVKSGVESVDNDIVLVTNELDTLKLFGTAKLPKVNSKPKSESKKKLNKNIAATIATTKLLSNKVSKDSIGDSSTSDNIIVALKQKSNGTQKKSNATGKKRAQSAVVFKKEAK